jgi:hypothetical protein
MEGKNFRQGSPIAALGNIGPFRDRSRVPFHIYRSLSLAASSPRTARRSPLTAHMPADYPFEIRPSPVQGLGAFATRRIPAGTRLIEYAGERLTPAEADARYPDGDDRHHTFLFAIDDDVVIDAAVNGNEARFINH